MKCERVDVGTEYGQMRRYATSHGAQAVYSVEGLFNFVVRSGNLRKNAAND